MGPASMHADRAAYYDQYFSLSDELFAVASFDGYFIDPNDRWSDVLDVTLEELKSKPFIEFVHEDDRQGFGEALAAAGRSGKADEMDVRTLTHDGTWRDIRATFFAVPEYEVFVGTGRDVTELKDTDLASATLAAIVQYSEDAIIGRYPDGRITTWNVGAERLFSYSSSEVLGRTLEFLAPSFSFGDGQDRYSPRTLVAGGSGTGAGCPYSQP